MNCKKAKEIKLSSVLKKIGAREKKKTNREIWYLSPFRDEEKASFKVNLNKNTWYDFGTGKGGNILDFVMLFFQTDLPGALKELDTYIFSFHQQKLSVCDTLKTYEIVKIGNLNSPALISYLRERKIYIPLAKRYCNELHYKVHNSNSKYTDRRTTMFTIAFKNDKAGYETRNKIFKNCLIAKAITTIQNGSRTLNLFEGFIDFLSYLTLMPGNENEDFIVTNSTSLVDNALEILPQYDLVKTFFDNDDSGKRATELIQQNCKKSFLNESLKFEKYNDVNDYLKVYRR